MAEDRALPIDEASSRQFLTFRLDADLYALPADEVSEIIRLPAVARVPQGPKGLLGIANFRGSALPVASLRGLLGRRERTIEQGKAIIIGGAAAMGLAVDTVEALVSVPAGAVETSQAELSANAGERLIGAFDAGQSRGFAKILDIRSLVEASFSARSKSDHTVRRAVASAAKIDGDVIDLEMLVTFEVAGQEFGFALIDVQEIVEASDSIAAVPHAEALLLGLMSYRDRLLPLMSLRGLLGFPIQREDRAKLIVVSIGNMLVGVLADRMRGIVPAALASIDLTPPVIAARAGGEARIRAIYRGDGGKRLISILAPDQLFREDVMQRLKADRRIDASPPASSTSSDERRFLVFRLGDDEFALPIETVDEVARLPDRITRLPKTPKFLEGVINLRGEVLPVIDQRRRFDMPVSSAADRRLIVMNTGQHKAGVIVDSVSEVLRFPAEAIEPAPDLAGEPTQLVNGVINLEAKGRIVLVLDPGELLTRAERGLLDRMAASKERPVS